MKWVRSDGFVLHWFFEVDVSFFVEDAVGAEGALDCIVGLEVGLPAAFWVGAWVLLLPQT